MHPSATQELQLTIDSGRGSIPCTFYKPENPRGVVLLGHGLSVDRFHRTVTGPAKILTDEFRLAVLVPELPLHGERADVVTEWNEFTTIWQNYWAGEGRDQILLEWNQIYAFATKFDLPILYFGLSLGTQYGILFLSQQTNVKAAVLGLFGSEPPPGSIIMNHCAPLVRTPVYFIQKQNDEIHPEENTRHLYESLGSDEKVLDSTPGNHQGVSLESLNRSCKFIAGRVDA